MSWKVIEILKGIRSSIGLQEVIKSSWKILQRSESIRSSDLPKFLKGSRKSSKSQENAQKVPKVLRPQVLNWSSKCPQIPQKVIKALEVLRGPQKVFKATSIPQNVINVLKILWSSKVPQMVIKWSSQSPQMFLKTVLKCSTRSHQKFLKGSSMFWDPHVHRSSKSPQKVHKVLKKSRKCTKGTQGPQVAGSQMILKMSSISSKAPQIPRSPHRSTKGIQGDIKVPKKLENPVVVKSSSKVLKRSTRSHQKFLKGSSMFWDPHVHRSSKSSKDSPQKVKKMHKRYPRSSGQVLKWSSKCPLFPQKGLKSLEVLIGPQKVFKATLKSPKSQRQNPVRQKFKKSSKVPKYSPQKVHKKSSKVSSKVFKKSSKDPQSPQKVKKMHKGTQGPQVSGSQMILKMSSISSKGPSSNRSTKGIQGDFKVLKNQSPQ